MKTVIYGLWHVHAEQYYRTAAQFTEVIGVYEPNAAWREAFCAKYNLPAFATPEEVWASGADAAIVCTATSAHTEAIVGLANAGIDIFTEKVLALSSEECARIAEAVEKNGVRFVISFVHLCYGGIRAVKQIADSGELGKINFFRFRNAHSGSSDNWLPPHFYNAKECGGGAMIDLGAHGMYLAHWFLGMPSEIKSVFTLACTNPETAKKNADGVEDNAVSVMRYEDGAIAINETGFVSVGCPMLLEIGGERGRVICSGDHVEKQTAASGKTEVVPPVESLASPLERFCRGIDVQDCGMEEATALTKMMEMAYGNGACALH